MSAEGRTTHVAAASGDQGQSLRLRSKGHLSALVITCVMGGAVLLFFLALYKVNDYPMPIGYDTPRYLFQTTLVAELGLAHVPHTLPPPRRSLATRTGFPVVVQSVSELFTTSTFKVAAMLPGAAATAVALAAGAFVSWGFRRSVWELGAVALIVGTSAVMVRLMAPETYTDNLLSAAVLVAALVPILSAIRDGPGVVCAALLLGLSGVIHPQFFGLFAATLVLVALVYVPGSWRAWRQGEAELLSTPAARLGAVLGGASVVVGTAFLGALRSWPLGARQTRFELAKKFQLDVPLYRFPLTVPLAALGAGMLGALGFGRARRGQPGSGDGGRGPWDGGTQRFAARFLLALSLAWGLVTVVGLLAYALGTGVAAHRLLSFLIPFPMLIALGILGLGRRLASRTRATAGVVVVVVGIGALAFLGYRDLYINLPSERGLQFIGFGQAQDTATALEYLERSGVPQDAPVVFVIDDRGPNPLSSVPELAYGIRSVLPAQRILHTYIYVGDPENYLAGKPTYRDRPAQYNPNVQRFWPTIERLLPRRPVALLLGSYNAAYQRFVASNPDSVIAPNVALLQGPKPRSAIPVPPFPMGPQGIAEGAMLGAGTLVVLGIIGLGWAVAALPRTLRPFEVLALSPAVGIGALVAGGVLVDTAGFRLGGAGGAVAPILVASSGFLAAWLLRRQRSPRESPV
ncbi:MAG: hypothetical protein ACRDHO_06180 [Actinomycetota bacterium]